VFVPAGTYFGTVQLIGADIGNRFAQNRVGVVSPNGPQNVTGFSSEVFANSLGETAMGSISASGSQLQIVPSVATPLGGQIRVTVQVSNFGVTNFATSSAAATWAGGSLSVSATNNMVDTANVVLDYTAAIQSSLRLNTSALLFPSTQGSATGQAFVEYFRVNSSFAGVSGCLGSVDFTPVSTMVTPTGAIDEVHRVSVTGGLPNATAAIFVSGTTTTSPIAGCDILNMVISSAPFPTLDASGNGSLDIPFPSTFVGGFFAQVAYVDGSGAIGATDVLLITG
jgi:hypothetical protein